MSEWSRYLDLASEDLGGAVLAANDEFFAPKENLLKTATPVFRAGEYTERGKWMDGWETRRRREPGHDWCLIRLGLPGVPRGAVVDTAYFLGNFPESCALEGIALPGLPTAEDLLAATGWQTVLPRSRLVGGAAQTFDLQGDSRVTHLRFSIFPDGGVARLRIHGEVVPDAERLARAAGAGWEIDLAAAEWGGLVVTASDMFFGGRQNLILPGLPRGMHDGWETRRRRGPGHDWALLRLGVRGSIHRVEVDTSYFKGNAPGSCRVEVADVPAGAESLDEELWRELLPQTALQPHSRHFFDSILKAAGPATHARFSIYPDGGVGRLRLFGSLA